MKNLYTENYETLKKETKELRNKEEIYLMLMTWKN